MKLTSPRILYIFSLFTLCHFFTSSCLEIMTYNIRRLGDDPAEHQWENRKQLIFDQIMSKKPAIIGFQEVVVGKQLQELSNGLPGYIAIGNTGRKAFATGWFQKQVIKLDKATNESNPIFYDPKRVTLINYQVFGINPVGHLFYASLPRICVRAVFKDANDKQFAIYNTHLSSSGAWGLKDGNDLIRERQMAIIIKNIKKKQGVLPTILMGDFNTRFEGPIKKKLIKAGFSHAKEKALVKIGPAETRTGWNNEQLKTIDHIFIKGKIQVAEYAVLESAPGAYPSDHRPVYAAIAIE